MRERSSIAGLGRGSVLAQLDTPFERLWREGGAPQSVGPHGGQSSCFTNFGDDGRQLKLGVLHLGPTNSAPPIHCSLIDQMNSKFPPASSC